MAILDVQMPEMDGFQLAREIKARPPIAQTILLVLTSLGEPMSHQQLAGLGLAGYLTAGASPGCSTRSSARLPQTVFRPMCRNWLLTPHPARPRP